MNIVIIGLSLSSSWGNGHATTYRSLIKGLYQEGHTVIFLEEDVSWYAGYRDLTSPSYCRLHLYNDPTELKVDYADTIKHADLVIVGSYVQSGIKVGEWVLNQAEGITAFYDIDTPVTLTKLDDGDCEYITPKQIPAYDLYLSFSGGKALIQLTEKYKAPSAKPLFCSVDPDHYYPEPQPTEWQLGYLGTYSQDRQSDLEKLLINTAKQNPESSFVVAGPKYPPEIYWEENIERIDHLPPDRHREFYNRQRFTLNLTRSAMVTAGLSPSVRLFEAGACATPIISDDWEGLDTLFEPDREILIAESTEDVCRIINDLSEAERIRIGSRARDRVLNEHTSQKRARQLIRYVRDLQEVTV